MKKILAIILMLMVVLIPTCLACEENEGGSNWQTGDLLVVTGCEEWVSLRKTASTKAQRLTKIPLGKSVYYLSEADDGFCHVIYGGKYGYVLKKYLTYDGTSVRYVTGCEEWISLREKASTKSDRLAKIPLGKMVHYTCMGADEEFAWVNYGNKGGYALEKYLSLSPFESGDRLHVGNCEGYVTLRDEPSVNGKALARLPKGYHVTVLHESLNGFMCVDVDGIVGYILGGYLTEMGPDVHFCK